MNLKTLLFTVAFIAAFSVKAQLSVDWYKHSEALDIYNPKKSVYNPIDSCIYTSGMFSGQFEFDGAMISSSFLKSFFLMKTKSNGELIWLKKVAENDYWVEMPSNVALTTDANGDLLLGITFNRKLFFGSDSIILPDDSFTTGGLLLKLDTSGTKLWHKQVFAYSIQAVASNGNNDVFLTGRTSVNDDTYLTAYSETGDSLWTRTGGSNSGSDEGKQIQIDDENNIYLLGFVDPNGGVYFDNIHPTFVTPYFWGSFLAKYNSTGQIQWLRCFYSSSFGNYVIGQSISIIGDRILVIGAFQGGIIKFYPSSATLNAANTALTGFILCYDSSGNLIWKKNPHSIPNASGSIGIELGTIVNDNLVCKGTFSGTVIIAGDTMSSVNNDLFLEAYDTLGNSIWHKQIFGANMDGATSFFKAEDDLVLNVSTKSQSLLVDNSTMMLAPVSDQMVVVRFNYGTLGISEIAENGFSVSPNPNKGAWILQTNQDVFGKMLRVFTISGELVYEQVLSSGSIHQINTPLSAGIYLLQLPHLSIKPIRVIIK